MRAVFASRLRPIAARLRRWFIRIALFLAMLPTLAVALYAVVNPPLTPLMVIRWLEGAPLRQAWRPLPAISPHLVRAVIAAEDNRFCIHHGFDTGALVNELEGWLDGERPRGASTITMQTAKNILLWPGRDWLRKAIEAWMTPQIELIWSKRRILEVYLNVAEMGPGIYGAERASREYFDKPARQLDRQGAARLAAVLPNPRAWSPAVPSPALARRAMIIAERADALGPLVDCVTPGVAKAGSGPAALAAAFPP